MKKVLFVFTLAMLNVVFFTSCEKERLAQGSNCDGYWNAAALDCSAASGICCLAPVVVKPSVYSSRTIQGLSDVADGNLDPRDYFTKPDVISLLTSLSADQIKKLSSGDYMLKEYVLTPDELQSTGTGSVKFFAGEKTKVDPNADNFDNYEFAIGIRVDL